MLFRSGMMVWLGCLLMVQLIFLTPFVAAQSLPDCVGSSQADWNNCLGKWSKGGNSYEGPFQNGMKNGSGLYKSFNGDVYRGDFRDDQITGYGRYLYADGRVYVGQFLNWKRHGQGTLTRSDGSQYEGEWIDDAENGRGILKFPNGIVYEGQFRDGSANGQGKVVVPDGRTFVGEYQNGNIAFGTLSLLNGETYTGAFSNNLPHGNGTYKFRNGTEYVGSFVQGKFEGLGTMVYPNGDVYSGSFSENKRNGSGTLTRTDGRRDVGDWKNDEMWGKGTRFGKDGSIQEQGYFENGVLTGDIKDSSDSNSNDNGVAASEKRIRLVKEGEVFKIPVGVNDVITLHFVVDSGASDVMLPEDVFRTLLRTGTLRESDLLEEKIYRLADGSTVRTQTFTIRKLKIGDVVVENVVGAVSDMKGHLLLGQGFLSRFRSWSFDNETNELILR